jgi:hypothetical protein
MPIPIPPSGSNFITLTQFHAMKQLYTDNSQLILQPPYQNQEILITSETFNGDVITAITQVTGFAGFRIYYGMSADLKVHAMLVATDIDGNDLLPTNPNAKFVPNSAATGGSGVIGEEAQRCPPGCG